MSIFQTALRAGWVWARSTAATSITVLEPLALNVTLDRALTLRELALAYHGMGRTREAVDTLRQGRKLAWQAANVRIADAIDALLGQWEDEARP